MTTTTLTRPSAPLAGAVTLGLTAAFMAAAYFGGTDAEDNSVGEYAVCMGIALVATAVVFGRIVPGAGRRTATVLAVLSVVFVPVYWLGLPLVLGAAAVVAGRANRAVAPQVLGGLVFLFAGVASVLGF